MNKKFACPICGYVHEGETAPETCPQCKQKVQWNVLEEGAALNFVTEHVIGIAKGTGDDMIKDLNAHFMGEATEVGTSPLLPLVSRTFFFVAQSRRKSLYPPYLRLHCRCTTRLFYHRNKYRLDIPLLPVP